jgi:hypothetical protein
MGRTVQLIAFAILLYGLGYWGQKAEHWNFKIFLFAFAIPAGFFFGWSVMLVAFPHLSVYEQIAITGGASLVAAGLAFVILHYTEVH